MRHKKNKLMEFKQALRKVQNTCSKQEKAIFDIRKKLYEWNLESDGVEEIISILIEQNFLDDARFSEFYVRDKFRFNKWGRIKLGYMLRAKNIDETYVSKALSQIDKSEYQKLLDQELLKKYNTIADKDTFQVKTKLLRFAQSKGFESELCLARIENLLQKKI